MLPHPIHDHLNQEQTMDPSPSHSKRNHDDMIPDNDLKTTIGTLGLMGLMIGLGQLLASDDKLTVRIIFGRALSSAGLGASAAAVLTFIPDLSLPALCGIACAIASLGTSFLEKVIQRTLGIK